MKNKPLIIIAGEPNSIFIEIYLKTIKKHCLKRPNILIISKNLLLKQMKFFKYNFKVNTIDLRKINFNELKKK